MDAQLKRGTLDICVLSSLIKADSYGYKIIKDLEDVMPISESTLYPILKRLEKNNLVSSYSVEFNGRLRKFYKIEKAGYEKIIEYLNDFSELIKVHKYINEVIKDER